MHLLIYMFNPLANRYELFFLLINLRYKEMSAQKSDSLLSLGVTGSCEFAVPQTSILN